MVSQQQRIRVYSDSAQILKHFMCLQLMTFIGLQKFLQKIVDIKEERREIPRIDDNES